MTSIIFKTYRHARVEQNGLSFTNRSVISDHDSLGEVVLRYQPVPANAFIGDPVIICQPGFAALVTSFGAGEPFEANTIAQQQVQTSFDTHYMRGITLDSTENRLLWLKNALTTLGKMIIKEPTIYRLVTTIQHWCYPRHHGQMAL